MQRKVMSGLSRVYFGCSHLLSDSSVTRFATSPLVRYDPHTGAISNQDYAPISLIG